MQGLPRIIPVIIRGSFAFQNQKEVNEMPEDKNLDSKDAQEIQEEIRQQAILRTAAAYTPPKSPEAREHLEWFRDQKFGLMIHWGLYNQLGLKESWPLVDNDWTKWQFRPGTPNIVVKEMYAKLHRGFLPLRFDPDEWADTAWAAGFRYLVFTTKHHDGFCMWDTKTTDYKVTGSEVPWRTEKYADITRALFDSFRAHGMGISAYFSRADFNCRCASEHHFDYVVSTAYAAHTYYRNLYRRSNLIDHTKRYGENRRSRETAHLIGNYGFLRL